MSHPALRNLLFVMFLVSLPCFIKAQDQPPISLPVRHPEAVAAVERAITLMGGRPAIERTIDVIAQGDFQEQSGDMVVNGSFVWKNSGKEFRYENTRNGVTQVFLSNGGSPAVGVNGKFKRFFGHVTLYHLPPHLSALTLVGRLRGAGISISALGLTTLGDRQALRVLMKEDGDPVTEALSSQVWFFEISSGLPIQVEYRLPDNSNAVRLMTATDQLSDFRSLSGILVPFRLVSNIGNEQRVFTVTSITFNTGISPSEFTVPPGGDQ